MTMNDGKCSIVVPVYNCEKTIYECIKSILKQNYTNLEIIIIDDGSTDNTLEICQSLALNDTRIVLAHKDNGGVSAARNKGIELSSGEYIMFIDGDDVLDSNYVSAFFSKRDMLDNRIIVLSKIDVIKNGSSSIVHEGDKLSTSYILPKDSLVDIWKAHLWNSPVNKVYIASVIKGNNIKFDENVRIGEDWLFNNSYAKYLSPTGFYVLEDVVYNYYMDSEPWRHCTRDEYYKINKRQCEDFKKTLELLQLTQDEKDKFDKSDLDFTISEIRYIVRDKYPSSLNAKIIESKKLAKSEQVQRRIIFHKQKYSFLDFVEFAPGSIIFVYIWENVRKTLGKVRRLYG